MTFNTEKMTNDILNILSREGGRDSISSVQKELRDCGWKRLGNLHDFGNIVEGLGFTLEFSKNRRYVTI